MKGAEAVLKKTSFLGLPSVEKFRVEKKYRAAELDRQIRGGRTKREARLLSKAKEAGVLCPSVLSVGKFTITMKFLQGEMLYRALKGRKITPKELSDAARILVKLHSAGVINTPDGMAVIDFGLGSISPDSEDKATDIVMMKKSLGIFSEVERNSTKMKKALGGTEGEKFVSAYSKAGGAAGVVKMVSEIENRARYMERG